MFFFALLSNSRRLDYEGKFLLARPVEIIAASYTIVQSFHTVAQLLAFQAVSEVVVGLAQCPSFQPPPPTAFHQRPGARPDHGVLLLQWKGSLTGTGHN